MSAEGSEKVWKGNKVKKAVVGRGCRDKIGCLGNEKPFNVARKQDVCGGKLYQKRLEK